MPSKALMSKSCNEPLTKSNRKESDGSEYKSNGSNWGEEKHAGKSQTSPGKASGAPGLEYPDNLAAGIDNIEWPQYLNSSVFKETRNASGRADWKMK